MSDLIAELRACGTDLAESAANEIERCHARLEIDHCFRMGPEPDLDMIRESVPFEKRAKFPDAVRCRDAEIALLEEDIASLRARLAEVKRERDRLREAAQQVVKDYPVAAGTLPDDLGDPKGPRATGYGSIRLLRAALEDQT